MIRVVAAGTSGAGRAESGVCERSRAGDAPWMWTHRGVRPYVMGLGGGA
jgi:hypothetical protein